MKYGYCRISRPKQSIERQIRNIKAQYQDSVIVQEVFTRTRMDRRQWQLLMKRVKAGDTIIFDSVSRMSGNAEEGFAAYEELFNDQRSVMSYLFFHDPESNYLFKSTEAHEFADCVEFLEDWGAGANFKLDIYYRMCDELVEAMRQCPALMATNASRYENEEKDLYDDPNLHLLAFDMIYSSQVYHLYDGISYSHPNSAEKKLYRAYAGPKLHLDRW